MTRILLDPATDLPDEGVGPVTLAATLLGPDPVAVQSFTVTDASTVVDLAAPTASQAWRLTVRRPRTTTSRLGLTTTDPGPIVAERTVHWADGAPTAWAALTDVDPATLAPTAAGNPLLDVSLDELRTTLLGGASTAFDTLKELETALGDDGNFAATVTAALAGKATPAQITAAITALGLGSASTHAATDFDSAGAAAAVATSVAATYVPLHPPGVPSAAKPVYAVTDSTGTTFYDQNGTVL